MYHTRRAFHRFCRITAQELFSLVDALQDQHFGVLGDVDFSLL